MAFTIRPFDLEDHDAANRLHRAVGWPARSDAGWRWLDENPARREIGAPAGWLIESPDGEPCGFAGNFVQRFHLDDQVLHGATGFSIIVLPQAKGQSRRLLRAFTAQPGVFARYVFNANPTSSPIFKLYDMAPWPPTTHSLKLSWRVDPLACAGGRVWREIDRRAPRLIDPRHERLMNPRLSRPADLMLSDDVARLEDLSDGSDYAAFWSALKAEGRLIADRSPAALRWRLDDPDMTLAPVLLAYRRGGAVTGYAMAVVAKNNPIEPPTLEIIDLAALRDEPAAIPALMKALIANGRRLGVAKVRIQVVNEHLLRRLGGYAASARREGGWGHCHAQFVDGVLGTQTWAPTPFDGDYGICQRPVPIKAAPASNARQAA